jgi:hypothetical protein
MPFLLQCPNGASEMNGTHKKTFFVDFANVGALMVLEPP